MKRLGWYMQIAIGVMLLFDAGFNFTIVQNLDVLIAFVSIGLNALWGAWGVWLIREGWRELNKIEEAKKCL